MWSKGQVLPQLSALLKICYLLNLSLLDFLTKDNFKVAISRDSKTPSTEKIRSKNKINDLITIEKTLKAILSKFYEQPPSLTAVAKELKINRRTITRRFPELCQAISNRYLKYRKSHRLQKNTTMYFGNRTSSCRVE